MGLCWGIIGFLAFLFISIFTDHLPRTRNDKVPRGEQGWPLEKGNRPVWLPRGDSQKQTGAESMVKRFQSSFQLAPEKHFLEEVLDLEKEIYILKGTS